MTHERFYCHRGFAAATSHHAASTVWWQAASPLGGVNRLFQVCLPSWRLRARGYPLLFPAQSVQRMATAHFRDKPSCRMRARWLGTDDAP